MTPLFLEPDFNRLTGELLHNIIKLYKDEAYYTDLDTSKTGNINIDYLTEKISINKQILIGYKYTGSSSNLSKEANPASWTVNLLIVLADNKTNANNLLDKSNNLLSRVKSLVFLLQNQEYWQQAIEQINQLSGQELYHNYQVHWVEFDEIVGADNEFNLRLNVQVK